MRPIAPAVRRVFMRAGLMRLQRMMVTHFGLTSVGAFDLAVSVLADIEASALADIEANDVRRHDGNPASS